MSRGNTLRPLCYLQGTVGRCREDNRQSLYHTITNWKLIYTLPCLYHVKMLGIEPSINWKCPPTSVLLQSSLWMTINSVHNLINQKKSIVDCHSIVLSLVEPNFWLGIKPLSITTVCRPRSYWSGRSESVVRTINSLYIK